MDPNSQTMYPNFGPKIPSHLPKSWTQNVKPCTPILDPKFLTIYSNLGPKTLSHLPQSWTQNFKPFTPILDPKFQAVYPNLVPNCFYVCRSNLSTSMQNQVLSSRLIFQLCFVLRCKINWGRFRNILGEQLGQQLG
jgi:hypothetical protein